MVPETTTGAHPARVGLRETRLGQHIGSLGSSIGKRATLGARAEVRLRGIDRLGVFCQLLWLVSRALCVGHGPDFMLKSPVDASKSFARVAFQ